jgi:hypothetical protein
MKLSVRPCHHFRRDAHCHWHCFGNWHLVGQKDGTGRHWFGWASQSVMIPLSAKRCLIRKVRHHLQDRAPGRRVGRSTKSQAQGNVRNLSKNDDRLCCSQRRAGHLPACTQAAVPCYECLEEGVRQPKSNNKWMTCDKHHPQIISTHASMSVCLLTAAFGSLRGKQRSRVNLRFRIRNPSSWSENCFTTPAGWTIALAMSRTKSSKTGSKKPCSTSLARSFATASLSS